MLTRRNDVARLPGSSHLHWVQLCQSGQDLSGLQGQIPRRAISIEEVGEHNTESDCWSVLDGRVYNMTPYLKYHPGGVAHLMLAAGGDCSNLFYENHPWVNGHNMLEKCYIGQLDRESMMIEAGSETSKFALHKTQWRLFKLVSKQTVSQQTVKFTFELPDRKLLGLEMPGQHLKVRATINGRMIERPFTPTSSYAQPATFDLIVKVYPDGIMSTYLDKLMLGDSVEMIGPQGTIGYPEAGVVTARGQLKLTNLRHVVMVAAGTGITPMMQLIRAIVENSKDMAKITLVDCNYSLEHIIARTQLEPLANMFQERVKVHHVLHEASDDDIRELGSLRTGKRLDKEMLAELLPKPSPDVAAFHCGPPAFDDAVSAMLKDIGYKDTQVFKF
uniref:Cytochrome-b5 reductase n=1 Tax=Hyaloperonospora arabidopsidis (strain Emoy2) TaxID=559515 RepID=M4B822_HYAAE